MLFGDVLALLGFGVTAVVFLILAREARSKHVSIAGYLLGDRAASHREFGASMVAASTSLATVLLFFLAATPHYGLTLFFCGISYLAGQILFIRILARSKIETSDLSTNAEFWRQFTSARWSAFVIGLLTVTAFLMILFIELYIGSVLVQYYLGGLSTWGKAAAFAILGAIVLGYVSLGGMRVVLKTDAWQLRLMLASMVALFIFAVTVPPSTSPTSVLANVFTVNASRTEIVLFWLWVGLLNIITPFAQLSSWQRIAATKSMSEAWIGLRNNIPSFLMVWLVPVLAFVLLRVRGYAAPDLGGLFDVMRAGPSAIEGLLYPIVFVGFASALFSTADTAMIALQLAVADRSFSGSYFSEAAEAPLKRRLWLVMGVTVALLAVVFGLSEAQLGAWFIPLVYAIFGQLAVIAPQIIYALLSRLRGTSKVQFSALGDVANVVAMMIAWAVAIGAVVLKATGVLPATMTQEIATFVSIGVSSLGVLVGHLSRRLGAGSV